MSSNNGFEIVEYTIQPGDTIYDLAGQYNTTVEDIMAANPNINPDNLMVGQVIAIPDPPPTRPTPQHRPGFRPERRPERRPEHRPEFRPEYRRPYRPPYYPYRPYPACPAGATTYIVQPGDSLYRISARFGIPLDAIIATNPYINFGIPLQIGQAICLPY